MFHDDGVLMVLHLAMKKWGLQSFLNDSSDMEHGGDLDDERSGQPDQEDVAGLDVELVLVVPYCKNECFVVDLHALKSHHPMLEHEGGNCPALVIVDDGKQSHYFVVAAWYTNHNDVIHRRTSYLCPLID